MEKLSPISSIGNEVAIQTQLYGFNSLSAFKDDGRINTYLRIGSYVTKERLRMLYDLEGIVHVVRLHNLPKKIISDHSELKQLKTV
jgi:hypothetical protein